MLLKSIFAAFAAVTAVAAAPEASASWGGWPGACLSDYAAANYVKAFTKTLQISGNETAAFDTAIKAVANPKVQEISDSVNFLANKPYGGVSLDGIPGFEAFHATSPPGGIYQVITLNIWHTCDVITWRWRFILYPGAAPIQGINVFVLGKNGKADIVYDEFNNVAWAQNLGYTITPPSGPPPA